MIVAIAIAIVLGFIATYWLVRFVFWLVVPAPRRSHVGMTSPDDL
jgi:hypothetical protein